MLLHEVERPDHELVVLYRGSELTLTRPADMGVQDILLALYRPAAFVDLVARTHDITVWDAQTLSERWALHYGLGSFQTARRAAFVMDRYGDDIEWDFASHLPGQDLLQLWHARRWRLLLNLLDRLPRNARYNVAVANDEEHAQMLADARREALASGGQPDRKVDVPLETWTPEVEKLTEVVDLLKFVLWATVNQNAKTPSKQPEPSARPSTAVQRLLAQAEQQGRRQRHFALAARMLPHKYQSTD